MIHMWNVILTLGANAERLNVVELQACAPIEMRPDKINNTRWRLLNLGAYGTDEHPPQAHHCTVHMPWAHVRVHAKYLH